MSHSRYGAAMTMCLRSHFICIPYSMMCTDPMGGRIITLVFLHYFGGSHLAWNKVVARLKHRYTCLALDAPGFGDAAGERGYSVEDMAQGLLTTLHTLASARVVLIGHSMTGKVAMAAASRLPVNLVGLVLVAPSPLEPEPMDEESRMMMADAQQSIDTARSFFIKGAYRQLSAEDIQQGSADAMRAHPEAFKHWPLYGSREDWSNAVPTLEINSLVIVGEEDKAIPLEFQKRYTMHHLRHTQLKTIKGAGHLLPYEAPEEVAECIETYIHDLSRSSPFRE
jgi:pimeloyl-ACP methyl ester carboxylesterase